MASRRRDIPIEGSWRVVDGENDSFDTSIIPSPSQDPDDPLAVVHSPPSSQEATQAFRPMASQDSIGDFTNNSQDSQNLLLDPFRPSIPRPQHVQYRTPEPEFRMPRVGVRGEVRERRRRKEKARSKYEDDDTEESVGGKAMAAVQDALAAVTGMVSWAFSVLFQAMRIAKLPLAVLLAVYLVLTAVVFILGSASNSIQSAFSPICAIPGISLLSVPFCAPETTTSEKPSTKDVLCSAPGASYLPFCAAPSTETSIANPSEPDEPGLKSDSPLPLDDIATIQARFEGVLRQSAASVTLPMAMRRSSRHIHNLRTLIAHSELDHRHELAAELESYVDTTGYAASALTRFEHHVASTVDDIINTNRLTLQSVRGSLSAVAGEETQSGLLAPVRRWWNYRVSEMSILDMYIHHTSLISERVVFLITEAEGVLGHLNRAQSHLRVVSSTTAINTLVLEQAQRRDDDDKGLWTSLLQTLRLAKPGPEDVRREGQLALLGRLEAQIGEAAAQLEALIATLEGMQVDLEMLYDRLTAPGALEGGGLMGPADLVLQVEAIRAGVERLSDARDRITTEAVGRLRGAERLELESSSH